MAQKLFHPDEGEYCDVMGDCWQLAHVFVVYPISMMAVAVNRRGREAMSSETLTICYRVGWCWSLPPAN